MPANIDPYSEILAIYAKEKGVPPHKFTKKETHILKDCIKLLKRLRLNTSPAKKHFYTLVCNNLKSGLNYKEISNKITIELFVSNWPILKICDNSAEQRQIDRLARLLTPKGSVCVAVAFHNERLLVGFNAMREHMQTEEFNEKSLEITIQNKLTIIQKFLTNVLALRPETKHYNAHIRLLAMKAMRELVAKGGYEKNFFDKDGKFDSVERRLKCDLEKLASDCLSAKNLKHSGAPRLSNADYDVLINTNSVFFTKRTKTIRNRRVQHTHHVYLHAEPCVFACRTKYTSTLIISQNPTTKGREGNKDWSYHARLPNM